MIATSRRQLKQFVLKPTVYCFHKCSYCSLRQRYYRHIVAERKNLLRTLPANDTSHALRPGHMPLDLALRTLAEAAALGMEELQISGGDPLLYPHLVEIIQAAKSYAGVFVLMNSVGTNVTVRKAREIIDAGLGAWNFSLDTLDPEKYDRLRGIRHGLSAVMEATAAVREAGRHMPEFRMNYMTVITRHNLRDLPELVAHAVDRGIASVYLMNVYGDETGTALLGMPEIQVFRDEIVPAILAVLRVKNTPEIVQTNAARVLASLFSRDNPDTNYAEGIYWADAESVRAACHVPDFYTLIEPDGRVLPCCLVEISHEGEVGNVNKQSLAEIWSGGPFERFRKERISYCRRCSSPRHRTLGLVPQMCRQFRE